MAERDGTSGGAVGGVYFAGILLVIVGIFGALEGLAAIIKDEFFVVSPNYYITIDATGWGWIHLILGILVAFAGFAVFAGRTWGRVVGIFLASLSAIANFMFLPIYPFWSILIIALDIWIIWALAVHGREVASGR
jgi:hypothetical protein